MAKEDLWSLIGRSRVDKDFGMHLLADLEAAIKEAGYNLDEEETKMAKKILMASGSSSKMATPEAFSSSPDLLQFQQKMMKERFSAQLKRMIELGEYTVQILKDTLNNAARAYKRITLMNSVMFSTGIGLFIFAAGYGALSREIVYSLVFGGLGAASFVALFLLGPIEKTQNALSNLVQVEVAFMNFFEQVAFWENFAMIPKEPQGPPDPANIEKASLILQERTTETMALLQYYVESFSGDRTRSQKKLFRKMQKQPEKHMDN